MTYLDRTDSFMYTAVGSAAYRVGGSVRDEILGRKVKDADYVVVGLSLDELRERLQEVLDFLELEKSGISALTMRDGQQGGWRVSGRGLGLIEVMLPRTEISTGPRHQDFKIVVDPGLSLEADAQRRDFTFNALYRKVWINEEIVDPTGRGLEDLQRRRINVTHADSFRDDPLRILRALRFISTLGYELGAETRALMALHHEAAHGLSAVHKHEARVVPKMDGPDQGKKAMRVEAASGTVFEEFSKLLMGDNAVEALRVARDTGVLGVALPELAPMLGFDQGSRYHDLTTDEHTFAALETAVKADAPPEVRWALLFHDSGKPASAWLGKDERLHYYEPSDSVWEAVLDYVDQNWDGAIVTDAMLDGIRHGTKPEDHQDVGADVWLRAAYRLNVPKKFRESVETLIANHMVTYKAKRSRVARERIRLGDEMLRWLYMHRMCDLTGKGKPNHEHLKNVAALEKLRADMERTGVPAAQRDLQIRGRDIVGMGVQGRDVGVILDKVLDEVALDEPGSPKYTREWQLEAASQWANDLQEPSNGGTGVG